MANGFDIMNVFKGLSPQPQAQAPAGQQQQQAPAGQQQKPVAQEAAFQPPVNTDPNAAQQAQVAPKSQETPLDQFTKLFENDPNEKPDPNDPNAPIWNIDPAKLTEQASGINFVDSEQSQELAANALKGDAAALMQLINGATQKAYVQAAQLSGMLSEKATKTGIDRMTKNLPNHVREVQSRGELEGINPMFKHPAMQPLVEPIRRQVQSRNPEASPQEIAKQVNAYLREVSASLGMKPTEDPTARRTADDASQDFESFFDPNQNW